MATSDVLLIYLNVVASGNACGTDARVLVSGSVDEDRNTVVRAFLPAGEFFAGSFTGHDENELLPHLGKMNRCILPK